MRRYLVVANQTLGGDQLMERLRACVDAGPCAVHVVVPASADPTETWHDHESDHALATRRLAEAMERFSKLGVDVTGEVGDHRPVDAVLDVMRRGEPVDEIIVSTLPAGVSRWLRLDALSRIERAVDVPVHHIITADRTVRAGGR